MPARRAGDARRAPAVPPGPADTVLNDRLAVPFTTPTAGGGYQGRTFNEEFDGDLGGGIFFRQTVRVGTRIEVRVIGTRQQVVIDPQTGVGTVVTVPVTANVQVPLTRTVRVPVAGRYSGILITDNDSPRPSDRLYFGYAYYDGIGTSSSRPTTGTRRCWGTASPWGTGSTRATRPGTRRRSCRPSRSTSAPRWTTGRRTGRSSSRTS